MNARVEERTPKKIREKREVCKKEGETQSQADPKLKSGINQQKSFNSGRSNTQGRLTANNMVWHILIACGSMLGVTLKPASGYSLEY
ncbi:MAG: hypothetical protein GY696_30915 [Gammaproteobacteria bacterium]|nr:hypothetical protein [Gammaproteobacteria bacterium]